jgi:tetratricopeptide (TPR) repeat protein
MNLMLFVPVLSLCGHNSLDCKSVQSTAAAELNTVAMAYVVKGQFEDARKTFARLLRLLDSSNSADGIDAARVYQLLGEISQIEGRIPDAEAAFKKSVALLTRYAGRQDFNTGRPKEASLTLQNAWTIVERVLPDDSPELIISRFPGCPALSSRPLPRGGKILPARFEDCRAGLWRRRRALRGHPYAPR